MELMLRADDLGMSRAINYGIYDCVKAKRISWIGLMTNLPSSEHGANLLRNEDVRIGLHFNFTTGYPLSDNPVTLLKEDGTFASSTTWRKNPNRTINKMDFLKELKAQYGRFEELIGRKPDYIDAHAILGDETNELINNFCKEQGIMSMMLGNDDIKNICVANFPDMDETNEYDVYQYVIADKAGILNSELALLIFHPGYIDNEVVGYSSYVNTRRNEIAFLLSSGFTEYLRSNKITII